MPAATAATFTGIHNENEFYSHHYLSEIFSGDIRATVDRWREAADAEGGRTPYAALRALAADYVRFRRDFDRERRSERRLTLLDRVKLRNRVLQQVIRLKLDATTKSFPGALLDFSQIERKAFAEAWVAGSSGRSEGSSESFGSLFSAKR